jgi:MoaA/NifB/PqqE/SkfB family radical SAM enzyme
MKLTRLVNIGTKYLLGHTLDGLGLIVTRRCNLTCPYCKIINEPKEELSTEQWKKIINRFIENKHAHFIFTGGEPLMYPGIYELISFASKKAATSLITNTSLLNEETFTKLKDLDFMTFSCDALEQKTLQKNTLSKLPLIQEQCKKYDIKASAIITVTSKNVDEIPLIIKQLHRHGIASLLSLIHSDKGDYDFRGYAPSLEFRTEQDLRNLERLQKTLLTMKKYGFKIAEQNDFIKNMSTYAKGEYQMHCPATEHFFTIDTDGYIKACHDTKASSVNALTFEDYNAMKKEVKATIPQHCTCYYDCYFNSQHRLKNYILQTITR